MSALNELTDEALRAEVERRNLLVPVEANDPHDGYYAYEEDTASHGYFGGDTDPTLYAWRSDAEVVWDACSVDGCEEKATTWAYKRSQGHYGFCREHLPELSYTWNTTFADGVRANYGR